MAAAAQMSPQERTQMVRGMVDRLAARLQENPDDLDGWRRLARAYDVLGEAEKAADARRRIAALEGR
jgi:cytochrome c-type biogenesis protein CcmH